MRERERERERDLLVINDRGSLNDICRPAKAQLVPDEGDIS